MRVFYFLMGIVFCTSCTHFSFSKNKGLQVVDTIVDFTSVDFSPSFKVCDDLIDKIKKSDCFRKTIHKKIGVELQKYPLTIKDSIDEVVYVDVLINSKGKIILKEIISTENLQKQLPQLDSLLRKSVTNLPIIYPAIKRGIPVSTKYRLPIIILLKE